MKNFDVKAYDELVRIVADDYMVSDNYELSFFVEDSNGDLADMVATFHPNCWAWVKEVPGAAE
jgi:hypothetical protein